MSKQEGLQGEALVADYLRNNGFQLVAHSYYCRFGEIDLIAWEGNTLCFIEVKTRTAESYGAPKEAVGKSKQERYRRIALCYWSETKSEPNARFDVAEVFADGRIEYTKNAF